MELSPNAKDAVHTVADRMAVASDLLLRALYMVEM